MGKSFFYNKNGYAARIAYESCEPSPRGKDKGNIATLMAWHPRFRLGDSGCPVELLSLRLDELPAYFSANGFVFLPLFMEDPDSDIPSLRLVPFETSTSIQIGFAYVAPNKLFEQQRRMEYSGEELTVWAKSVIKEEVTQFQNWLTRTVRHLMIVEDTQTGEVIASQEIPPDMEKETLWGHVEEVLKGTNSAKPGFH